MRTETLDYGDRDLALRGEMRDAKVDWQMTVYGNTGHSFTNATAMNRPGFF